MTLCCVFLIILLLLSLWSRQRTCLQLNVSWKRYLAIESPRLSAPLTFFFNSTSTSKSSSSSSSTLQSLLSSLSSLVELLLVDFVLPLSSPLYFPFTLILVLVFIRSFEQFTSNNISKFVQPHLHLKVFKSKRKYTKNRESLNATYWSLFGFPFIFHHHGTIYLWIKFHHFIHSSCLLSSFSFDVSFQKH